jgi:hypothetical protein
MDMIYSAKIKAMHPKENIPYMGDILMLTRTGMDRTLD